MPKILTPGEREMVLNVKRFCELEKQMKGPLIPLECIVRRTAAITGISEKTVSRISKEEKAGIIPQMAAAPKLKRNREKKIKLSEAELNTLRRKIHEFYSVRKELPTLTKLLHEMRDEIDFKGSRTTLWRIIKETIKQVENEESDKQKGKKKAGAKTKSTKKNFLVPPPPDAMDPQPAKKNPQMLPMAALLSKDWMGS